MATVELHPDVVSAYHAHVYYTPETRAKAAALRARLGELFPVQLGRWHDVPVGPHSQGMYQVLFMLDAFASVLPWLMLNRRGPEVLVHPETGDEVADHTAHALWLGNRLPLRLDALQAH
jgi:aromatic ring-cleaving dioxygenase